MSELARPPDRSPWSSALAFTAVGLGAALASLDTAVNIALPDITRFFAIGVGDIQWVVICYVLTYSSLMLVCGKIGDLIGHRLVFRAGLIVSIAAFVLCSLPSAYGWLLAARFLQGIGAALVLSCAPALATQIWSEARRTQALSIYGTMMAAGSAIGPSFGGLLVELWGWSAVFGFRVPIAAAALMLSWLLPARPRAAAAGGFDFAGAVLLATTMSSLLLALVTSRLAYLPLWLPVLLAPLGLGLMLAFVLRARRVAEPILRPAIFADSGFTILILTSVAMHCASFAVLLIFPYYLVDGAGFSPLWGGLAMALSPIGTMAGSSLGAPLALRLGRGRTAALGLVLCAGGLWGMGTALSQASFAVMATSLAIQGLGVGLFQLAFTDIVTATLPIAERGVAGSLAMVTRTLGVVSGASLLSAVFLAAERQALAAGLAGREALLAAFSHGMQIAGLGLAIVVLLTALKPRLWLRGDDRL